MIDRHIVKDLLSQAFTTVTFGLTCLAVSALILAHSPRAEKPKGRAGDHEAPLPADDFRYVAATDCRESVDLARSERVDAIGRQLAPPLQGR